VLNQFNTKFHNSSITLQEHTDGYISYHFCKQDDGRFWLNVHTYYELHKFTDIKIQN